MKRLQIVAGALALFLLARAGYAALRLLDEFREHDFHARPSVEERIEGSLGADYALFCHLRDTTPEQGSVFFLGRRDLAEPAVAFSRMQTLLYPRRFHALEQIPVDWNPGAQALDGSVSLVAFGEFRETDLAPWFREVADGPRFRLWRFGAGQ